jgi:hypothetical protein
VNNDVDKSISQIKKAFPLVETPLADWENCKSVDDFVMRFGEGFFSNFWRAMHDDDSITRFMLPYVMQFFLSNKFQIPSDDVDYFIGRLDPVAQRETQLNYSVERLFQSLTPEQRVAICDWLHVVQKRHRLLFNVKPAIEFWCRECV